MKRDRAAYMAGWRKKNPEKYAAILRRGYPKRTRYHRTYYLMKRYNLTRAGFAQMLAAQNGQCLICGVSGDLVVDHCHMTLRVRGLICDDCNISIGRLLDDPTIARNLASYLERNV